MARQLFGYTLPFYVFGQNSRHPKQSKLIRCRFDLDNPTIHHFETKSMFRIQVFNFDGCDFREMRDRILIQRDRLGRTIKPEADRPEGGRCVFPDRAEGKNGKGHAHKPQYKIGGTNRAPCFRTMPKIPDECPVVGSKEDYRKGCPPGIPEPRFRYEEDIPVWMFDL